jgi:hypothetical protein
LAGSRLGRNFLTTNVSPPYHRQPPIIDGNFLRLKSALLDFFKLIYLKVGQRLLVAFKKLVQMLGVLVLLNSLPGPAN